MMRHGSLFSGIGGFDLAASWMGWVASSIRGLWQRCWAFPQTGRNYLSKLAGRTHQGIWKCHCATGRSRDI